MSAALFASWGLWAPALGAQPEPPGGDERPSEAPGSDEAPGDEEDQKGRAKDDAAPEEAEAADSADDAEASTDAGDSDAAGAEQFGASDNDEQPAEPAGGPGEQVKAEAEGVEGEADEVELTPEELAEIEAAVEADSEARQEDAPEAGASADAERPLGFLPQSAAAFLPDISIILDVALAYFSEEENLQSGAHDPVQTGFNFQQLELSLRKSVDPYFRFDSNIVFAPFGVEIEEAYATTMALPWGLQARAGQFLTQFGRINRMHPHSWDFVDQPFMWGKVFGGEGNRGLGLELSWLMPLPWFVVVVGSVTDAAGAAEARSFYGGEDQGINGPLDFQNTAAIEQFFELHDDWSLMWGLSAVNGPNPSGRDTRTDIYGTDVYLKYRPITRQSFTTVGLTAEWLYRRRQVPFGIVQDTGGYLSLLWRFAQRWATGGRYEYGSSPLDGEGAVTADPLDPEQTAERHRGTVDLTFYPTEFSRLRAQGSGDFPAFRRDPIWAAFLAFEVVVGSHGAHDF